MRKLFLLLAFVSTVSYGGKAAKVNASANNVPVAYDNASAGSKVLLCNHGKQVMIQNETGDRIAWGIGLATTEPSGDHGYVVANTTVGKDGVTVSAGNYIYIRSDSGAPIAAGTIEVECW